MNPPLFSSRLAVCSWSLQPSAPRDLIQQMQAIGVNQIQLALDPVRENPPVWGDVGEQLKAAGFSIVSGMFGTVGEDYSTLESIRCTGGLVPDSTWEQNWRNIQANVILAEKLGMKVVTFHAGFLPHDESDPGFRKLIERIGRVADLFGEKSIHLGFETGQETANCLQMFLDKLDRRTVGVNFDPANLILYEKGDPIDALRLLGPWLKQCHIKDAIRTRQPGSWGEEVVVGTGEVNWPAFFQTLNDLKFPGYLCIEREAGTQRVQDIRAARQHIESVLSQPAN
ncbi:MAG: sugar phosphate isomerase/epimerase family protein [Verrucomicrobiota bacterium]